MSCPDNTRPAPSLAHAFHAAPAVRPMTQYWGRFAQYWDEAPAKSDTLRRLLRRMRLRADQCGAVQTTSMVLLGWGLMAAAHAGILITNLSLADQGVTVARSGRTPNGDPVVLATANVEFHPRGCTVLNTKSLDTQGSFSGSHATDRDLIGFASLSGGISRSAGRGSFAE